MDDSYADTALTPMRVARLSGYIDWAAQPSLFKHYPAFLFRYPYGSQSMLKRVERSRFISSRSTIGAKPYYQLNIPSAGNLHPTELYVQIRGVKGVLSGIYHVDALHEELVLIREVEHDGLEQSLGLERKFSGMLFVISCVPFRSEWKYGERALRYCYMDAGHQAGALCASAAIEGQSATILSGFEAERLNRTMGFAKEEFAAAVIAVGERTEKPVAEMRSDLMQVAPTDYCESRGEIPLKMAGEPVFDASFAVKTVKVDEAVLNRRRSARHFTPEPMPNALFEHFMHSVMQAPEPLATYAVVLQSSSVDKGLYNREGLIKAGDFAASASALLVDQRFVSDAAIIVVMTSKTYGSGELMAAGAFAQTLYLDATDKGAGFTGIGAFYDKKLQAFLGTNDPIIYVGALGTERK